MQRTAGVRPKSWLISQVDDIHVRQRGRVEDEQLGSKVPEQLASAGMVIVKILKSME